jgi:hypothetical protein
VTRAYVAASGLVFLAVVGAHVARLIAEGTGPLHEPIFIVATLLALGLAGWALVSLRRR